MPDGVVGVLVYTRNSAGMILVSWLAFGNALPTRLPRPSTEYIVLV